MKNSVDRFWARACLLQILEGRRKPTETFMKEGLPVLGMTETGFQRLFEAIGSRYGELAARADEEAASAEVQAIAYRKERDFQFATEVEELRRERKEMLEIEFERLDSTFTLHASKVAAMSLLGA